MKGYTTTDWADMIAESFTNGQHEQAVRQWHNAIADSCDTRNLMEAIIQSPNMQLVDSWLLFFRIIKDMQETMKLT